MKKLMVVSDTHGRVDYCIDQIGKHPEVNAIIHLGDTVRDAEFIKKFTTKPIYMVRGNNDWTDFDTPEERILELEGHRLLLVHGHKQNVYWGYDRLVKRAKEVGADIVLFGHTHMYYGEYHGKILLVNPGALSYARGGDFRTSYVLLTLDGDRVEVERILEE